MSDDLVKRLRSISARQDGFDGVFTADEAADCIEKLKGLLFEARSDLAAYVEADYPEATRTQYPDIQRRWHRDMELCRQIDTLMAREEPNE